AAAPTLVARRIEHARVGWIDRDVSEARVLVDGLDLVPALSAVGRLVDAAVSARSEEMPRRRDVDDVRTPRIDHDARNRLRRSEAEVGEGLAAVFALVDPVAEARGLAAVRLAGADVDDVRIRRMDGDVADGCAAVGLEHRRERRAV